MAKFTSEEKISAVKRYLNGNEGHKVVAKSVGVTPNVFRNWVKQFQYSGEQAFEKAYTNYTVEYKLKIISYMNEYGTSLNETAAIFNIPAPTTIRDWLILFEHGGVDALKPKKKGRRPFMKEKKQKKSISKQETVEDLQAELEYLRAENAYLKKLQALVQEKEASERKKKRK